MGASPSLDQARVKMGGARKGETYKGGSWWGPLLIKLDGLKTWFYGPRMDSTKKRDVFQIIYSFQKV